MKEIVRRHIQRDFDKIRKAEEWHYLHGMVNMAWFLDIITLEERQEWLDKAIKKVCGKPEK